MAIPVQTGTVSNSNGTQATSLTAFPSLTTIGNRIVVVIALSGSTNNPSPTVLSVQSSGTISLVTGATISNGSGSSGVRVEIWAGTANGKTQLLTVNASTACNIEAVGAEYDGTVYSLTLDGTPQTNSGTSTGPASANISTANANDLLIFAAGWNLNQTGWTTGPTNSFTDEKDDAGAGGGTGKNSTGAAGISLNDLVVSTTQTNLSSSGTIGSSVNWATIILAFQKVVPAAPSLSGPPVLPPPTLPPIFRWPVTGDFNSSVPPVVRTDTLPSQLPILPPPILPPVSRFPSAAATFRAPEPVGYPTSPIPPLVAFDDPHRLTRLLSRFSVITGHTSSIAPVVISDTPISQFPVLQPTPQPPIWRFQVRGGEQQPIVPPSITGRPVLPAQQGPPISRFPSQASTFQPAASFPSSTGPPVLPRPVLPPIHRFPSQAETFQPAAAFPSSTGPPVLPPPVLPPIHRFPSQAETFQPAASFPSITGPPVLPTPVLPPISRFPSQASTFQPAVSFSSATPPPVLPPLSTPAHLFAQISGHTSFTPPVVVAPDTPFALLPVVQHAQPAPVALFPTAGFGGTVAPVVQEVAIVIWRNRRGF